MSSKKRQASPGVSFDGRESQRIKREMKDKFKNGSMGIWSSPERRLLTDRDLNSENVNKRSSSYRSWSASEPTTARAAETFLEDLGQDGNEAVRHRRDKEGFMEMNREREAKSIPCLPSTNISSFLQGFRFYGEAALRARDSTKIKYPNETSGQQVTKFIVPFFRWLDKHFSCLVANKSGLKGPESLRSHWRGHDHEHQIRDATISALIGVILNLNILKDLHQAFSDVFPAQPVRIQAILESFQLSCGGNIMFMETGFFDMAMAEDRERVFLFLQEDVDVILRFYIEMRDEWMARHEAWPESDSAMDVN